MKLDSRQVELIERVAKVINGLVIVVKEDGIIRQVTSMDHKRKISLEKEIQLVDKTKEK